MQIVSASTIEQLDQHLRNAFNNNEDYDITLTGSLYMVAPYNADNPGLNPAPQYPYGPPGTERSSLPQIRSNVTIKASEAQYATLTRDLSASATYRHLYVRPGGSLTLERIVLEKGDVGTVDTGGGAILSQGVLTATHCRFGPDNKSNYGGAILNLNGTAILENCDIFGNEADWGGGLYNGFSPAVMTVTNCRVAENRSVESWAVGGGIANMDGTLTVTGSAISDNSAATGGGIACYGIGQATLQTAIVRSNHAGRGGAAFVKEGGTISLACSAVTSNTATTNGPVAWIENTGSITFENCWLPLFDRSTQPLMRSVVLPDLSTAIGNISSGDVVNPLPPRYPEFQMVWQEDATLLPVFVYNRIEAANYAIEQSRSNFEYFPYGDDDYRNFPVNRPLDPLSSTLGSVGGPFYYPFVHHAPGEGTGSSVFISELLHIGGGLPMIRRSVNGDDCAVSAPPKSDGSGLDWQAIGWRVCCNANLEANDATGTWRNHNGIRGFFGELLGTITFNELTGYVEGSGPTLFNLGAGTYIDEEGFKDFVYTLFAPGGTLAELDTGDYVFLSDESHGFLIVGWGPAYECPDALNAQSDGDESGKPNAYFTVERQEGVQQIPYVVDFCYGYANWTGWTQDPRPRPFYCSAASIAQTILDRGNDSANIEYYGFIISEYLERLVPDHYDSWG